MAEEALVRDPAGRGEIRLERVGQEQPRRVPVDLQATGGSEPVRLDLMLDSVVALFTERGMEPSLQLGQRDHAAALSIARSSRPWQSWASPRRTSSGGRAVSHSISVGRGPMRSSARS